MNKNLVIPILVATILFVSVLAPENGAVWAVNHVHTPPKSDTSSSSSSSSPKVNLIEKGPAATSASGVNGPSGGKAANDYNPPSTPSNSINICNKQVIPGYDCFGNKINVTPSTPPTTSDTCPNGYGLVENTHECISLSSPPPPGTGKQYGPLALKNLFPYFLPTLSVSSTNLF